MIADNTSAARVHLGVRHRAAPSRPVHRLVHLRGRWERRRSGDGRGTPRRPGGVRGDARPPPRRIRPQARRRVGRARGRRDRRSPVRTRNARCRRATSTSLRCLCWECEVMPLVNIQMAAGRTPEQKRAVMTAVTDAVVEHLGVTTDSVRVWPTSRPAWLASGRWVMVDADVVAQAAALLRRAASERTPCPPLRDLVGSATDVDAGYAIQQVNTDLDRAAGRRVAGRKIGLTSKAVQDRPAGGRSTRLRHAVRRHRVRRRGRGARRAPAATARRGRSCARHRV